MKRLLILTALVSTFSFANGIDDKCADKVIWGAPQIEKEGNNQYLCRIGYAVNYDYTKKVAHYAVEHIKSSNLVKTASRKDDFREDPEVPAEYRSTLKDYARSGYDRGHIAPAADMTYSPEAMSESFYLTNMMPQVPGNNRGIWKQTETMARDYAVKYGEVYVISGTIYETDTDKAMGNNVMVPSHLYKIIIDPKNKKALSFIFPNIKLDVKKIDDYVVTIKEIEKRAKINISPKMPKELDSIEQTATKISDW